MRVITFGTYDVFHVGHLRLLATRARALGSELIAGVSTDELTLAKKDRLPINTLSERLGILRGLRVVDDAFPEESLEQKREYILRYRADILVMGDDWSGRFNEFSDICKVVYLPRTPAISTTAIIERIKS